MIKVGRIQNILVLWQAVFLAASPPKLYFARAYIIDIMGYFTAFKLSLSKSKLITTKTPHKKSYARMIQWKGPSVLCRTRGWRSSNYTSFALRFHKTLKSAEVSKVFLLLYFFVIRFQLIIAGGILIFASWCCRFTPGWRYTVTSLNDKYQSVVKGHSHNMSNTHDRVWPSTSFPVPFPSKGKGPGNEVGLTTLPNSDGIELKIPRKKSIFDALRGV